MSETGGAKSEGAPDPLEQQTALHNYYYHFNAHHALLHGASDHCHHISEIAREGTETAGDREASLRLKKRFFRNALQIEVYLQLYRLFLLDPKMIHPPSCSSKPCEYPPPRNLHICLHCGRSLCLPHMRRHLLSPPCPWHVFSTRVEAVAIYCALCSRHVYASSLMSVVDEAQRRVATIQMRVRGPALQSRCDYVPPVLTPADLEAIAQSGAVARTSFNRLSLRGLNNLGNTCFINVILQALIHNPALSTYFLADKHNPVRCPRARERRMCLGCEFDRLVATMFSGEEVPYSPHVFVYATWQSSTHFAGCEQHDAHDFFICALNTMHAHIALEKAPTSHLDDLRCPCIIHRNFSGAFRSVVACPSCSAASISLEPFFGISVDMGQHTTLQECLRSFVSLETLDNFKCARCQGQEHCTKQFSIYLLPLVLCLHIKRFRQRGPGAENLKNNAPIQFPLNLDMTPYTGAFDATTEPPATATPIAPSAANPVPPDPGRHIYSLFAVVNHTGDLNQGHYTCYIRHDGMWFLCDDQTILAARLNEVLGSQAYLLFYIRSIFDYGGTG